MRGYRKRQNGHEDLYYDKRKDFESLSALSPLHRSQ